MAEEYDPIESVLDQAMEYARERSHEYVVLEHLLLALANEKEIQSLIVEVKGCLLYTSPSPRDPKTSRMPSSA